jgi:anhydro-N-acetylmuramic acid kinase
MSGTSADGVDVALVRIEGRGMGMRAKLLGWHHRGFSGELRESIVQIRMGTPVAIGELAQVGREISLGYAATVNEALLASGLSAGDIDAVAAHGQTLFHRPPDTIQWLDPALIASEVGCAVVSDFRRADCAAGGQGAPLVPLADYLLFRDDKKNRLMLNLGGIANVTFLRAGGTIEETIAFDTGPANCVSDFLCRDLDPPIDLNGEQAGEGRSIEEMVKRVLAAEYFSKPPPKSTDGPGMIELFVTAGESNTRHRLEDLLRSACEVGAEAVARAAREFLPGPADEVIASGGGTKNLTLMRLLAERLGMEIRTVDEFGIPSSAKEAIAFALLGAATLDGLPGNVPSATGARRGVVLGSITPKP